MTKKTIITVLALTALAVICAGLPYVTGLKAEKYFHKTMTAFSETPSVNFRVKNYKRGWFASYAESEIEIILWNRNIPVVFEHEIKHGPSLTNVGLAKIITKVRFSGKIQNELNHYFMDRSPIEIITHVGMLGGQQTEFAIPPFDGHPKGMDDINISWQRVDGNIELSSDMSRYTGVMRVPLLAVSGENGEAARIDSMVMDMDMKQRAEGLWLGRAVMNIAGVYVDFDKQGPGAGNETMKITGISFDQTSSEEAGLLLQSMTGRAESLTVMDRTFKEGVFDSEIRNVSMDAYLDLQRTMKAIAEKQLPPNEAGKQIVEAMMDILPEFLRQSPEYTINRLTVSSDQGDVTAHASVKYVGNGDFKAFHLLNDLACDAMLSVPKELLKDIALTYTREQISRQLRSSGTEKTEEELENLSQQTVDNNIEGLLQNNIIVAVGDNYTARFALNNTGMMVNGRPLNIP